MKNYKEKLLSSVNGGTFPQAVGNVVETPDDAYRSVYVMIMDGRQPIHINPYSVLRGVDPALINPQGDRTVVCHELPIDVSVEDSDFEFTGDVKDWVLGR